MKLLPSERYELLTAPSLETDGGRVTILPPHVVRHFGARVELFPARVGRFIDEIKQPLPRLACRVLQVSVDFERRREDRDR